MFKLGKRSLAELVGVHPIISFAVTEAIKITTQDFMVFDGVRSEQEQRDNIARGVSWTMKSEHLPGRAVDLVTYINGQPSWSDIEAYKEVTKAMKTVIEKYDLPIVHGYDLWGKDWPHWQLKKSARNGYDIRKFRKKIKGVC